MSSEPPDPVSASTGYRPERAGPVFLALVGPTASGKTSLSIEVARALGGEIVSMDSRQIYRGMDVGTAKVEPDERSRVPHHGLDIRDPDERYSAGAFAADARRWIREIRSRGRVPILVGGTGFFLRALTHPIFREPPMDAERRDRLRTWLEEQPARKLRSWVRVLDSDRAEVAVEGGPRRMSRTLEVALLTGRPLSWWHEEADRDSEALEGVTALLTLPREELDRRIRSRVDRMAEMGLVEEVRALLEAGYGPDDPGLTGVGYREIVSHLRGELPLEEALERIEVATRQYARRQLTWFRNQLPDEVIRVDATRPLSEQVETVVEGWDVGKTASPGDRAERADARAEEDG